jgi:hypothetical protein
MDEIMNIFSRRDFWILLAGVFVMSICFGFLYFSTTRSAKKRWEIVDPDNATAMYYHGTDVTPNKGDFFVRVSDYQWVHIFWDKNKKSLIIQRPVDTWKHREEYPIGINELNWKVVAERQPVRVSVKDYFVRQVM